MKQHNLLIHYLVIIIPVFFRFRHVFVRHYTGIFIKFSNTTWKGYFLILIINSTKKVVNRIWLFKTVVVNSHPKIFFPLFSRILKEVVKEMSGGLNLVWAQVLL